jgi:hypothetical protein
MKTNISWNSRNFKVIVNGQAEYGTACEEWTGWDLTRREQYLNNLFGKGEWSWE